MPRLKGKVALVTGASRGIGKGIALRLAEEGADVVVNYRSHAAEAGQVADAIAALGRQALAWQADVSDRAAVERMVAGAVGHFGALDIAVANAASQNVGSILETRWEDNLRTFEVSLFGVFHVCQLCAQQLVRQVQAGRPGGLPPRSTGGKLILISSIMGLTPYPGRAAYTACKAAIIHLARTLALELAPYHINVNAISPGWIDTPGERDLLGDAAVDRGWQAIPWKRLGRPEEIGAAAAYLASDDADFVTGTNLVIDGGGEKPE
jgi:glucose 1-dehydrogenase